MDRTLISDLKWKQKQWIGFLSVVQNLINSSLSAQHNGIALLTGFTGLKPTSLVHPVILSTEIKSGTLQELKGDRLKMLCKLQNENDNLDVDVQMRLQKNSDHMSKSVHNRELLILF